MKRLELWADSFHEGQWACDQLGTLVKEQGGRHTTAYEFGFIPVHTFHTSEWSCEVTVYGDYNAWDSKPAIIEELLAWGKPDLSMFDPESGKIVFAVEETAATPTGNQATQRCERQYGAMKLGVPFWYLLAEYGLHKDGGVRRDSIFPTIMALKLSQDRGLPSLVLHYSDLASPEDYAAGSGLRMLFGSLLIAIRNAAVGSPPFTGMVNTLTDQYHNMLTFLASQWTNQLDFLPGVEALKDPKLPLRYAEAATGSTHAKNHIWAADFLRWPLTSQIATSARPKPVPVVTDDELSQQMELDIDAGLAYGLSSRKGSKPQPPQNVDSWLELQFDAFIRSVPLVPPANWRLRVDNFQSSPTGLLHVTRSQRISYLYDRWSDFVHAAEIVYPRLVGKLQFVEDDLPTFVYISNSLKPGRIFGDPFTGQLAAYAVAFGKLDVLPRRVVAYFPHQAHPQVSDRNTNRRDNKGMTIMTELTDLLLFGGGVGYRLQTGDLL